MIATFICIFISYLLAELHGGYAVLQQAARTVVALEHRHEVTRLKTI
jgi:hypothetical protein